ncbi:MAG: HEAT repeat domain-containing protein [Myxococcota bacterium]
MNRITTITTALALGLAFTATARAQGDDLEEVLVHDRARGELSEGTGAPTQEALMRAIGNGSPERLIATLEYGEHVECHACVPLVERNLLGSDDAEVRRISAWWLRHRVFAIAQIFHRMEDVLASDADPVRRARAARAIGEFMLPAGLGALQAAYGDESAEVREAVVLGLARLNHSGANVTVAAALADADAAVRRAAIEVINQLNFFRDTDALVGALADDDAEVRTRAAYLVGQFRADGAEVALAGLLRSDESVNVRQAAAIALGRLGTSAAREALVDARDRGDDSLVLDAIDVALRF